MNEHMPQQAKKTVFSESTGHSCFWIGCFLSRAWLIIFILTSGVGLMPDEAQYWTWSLFPGFGYYSKPPGIAWQIYAGTHLFGMNELGVRIFSLLLPIPMALFIKGIVRLLTANVRIGYLTGLAFLLSPIGMSASILATTDGGMLLFGLASVYFYLKNASYTQTGFCIALGALWKWMSYALLLPFFLYEIIQGKVKAFSLITMSAIAALGLIPALLWNVSHNFATFRHVEGTLLNTHSSHAAANPLSFILAGFLLVSPGFFLLAMPALFSTKRDKTLLLRLIVWSIFGGMLFVSCFRKVQGNWAVLGQVFLFPLMGCFLTSVKNKWMFPSALLLSLLLQTVFLAGPYLLPKSPETRNFWQVTLGKHSLEKSPLRHGIGLDKIEETLIKAGYTPEQFLFSDRYQTVSLLWFYGPGKKKVYFFNISHLRRNQFCFWPGMEKECVGKNGLFATLVPAAERNSLQHRARRLQKELKAYFAHIGKPEIYPLESNNSAANYLLVIPAYNYSGLIPEQKNAY